MQHVTRRELSIVQARLAQLNSVGAVAIGQRLAQFLQSLRQVIVSEPIGSLKGKQSDRGKGLP